MQEVYDNIRLSRKAVMWSGTRKKEVVGTGVDFQESKRTISVYDWRSSQKSGSRRISGKSSQIVVNYCGRNKRSQDVLCQDSGISSQTGARRFRIQKILSRSWGSIPLDTGDALQKLEFDTSGNRRCEAYRRCAAGDFGVFPLYQ